MVVPLVRGLSSPARARSGAPCGSRLFEVELKVALAKKDDVIAKKIGVAATAQTAAARARNALQMAASRQAAFRTSRAATVKRLVGVATHEAILEADEACEEALAAMEMRATTAEREIGELRVSLGESRDNTRYWRGESKKNARMRSDPAALRRKDREMRELRVELHRLRVQIAKYQLQGASSGAAEAKVKLNLPQRGRGKGAGRGCPFPNWFRRMVQKLITIGVPASSATEAIATIVEGIIPEEVIDEHGGMELPDWSFMKQQRTEVAALHHICAGMAFARSTRVVDFETDESPLNQQSFGVMPMRLEEMVDGEQVIRMWSGVGMYQLAGQTAKEEAEAMNNKCLGRLNAFTKLYLQELTRDQESVDAAYTLALADEVGAHKCAGAVGRTDNATPAIASIRHFGELVGESVDAWLGPDKLAAMSPEEQKAAKKIW